MVTRVWVDSHCHLQLAGGDEHVARARRGGRRVDGVRRHRSRDVAGGARRSPTAIPTCTPRSACIRTTRRSSAPSGRCSSRSRVSDACVAIGECGFDLFYEHSPRDEQETAFRFQIRLAKHTRQAARDPLARRVGRHVPRARRRRRSRAHDLPLLHRRPGGGARRARARLLPVVQRHRLVQERRRRCARRRALAPADRVLVETDSPFLTPEPYRGKPNEPALVVAVGAALARARGVEPEEIAEIDARERGARASASSGDPERDPRAPRRATGSGRRRRSARTSSPTRTPRAGSCGSRSCSRATGSSRSVRASGSLTVALADAGAHVCAIELDRHLVPILEEVVAGRDVEVVQDDALRVDWDARARRRRRGSWSRTCRTTWRRRSSSRALETAPMIERMLVMVQREVGERLAAGAGDDAYGAVSVKVAYYAAAKVVGTVSPNVFVPKPEGRERAGALGAPRRAAGRRCAMSTRMFELVRAGFATRRKTLRNTLDGTGRRRAFRARRHRSAGARRDARRSPIGRGWPMREVEECASTRSRSSRCRCTSPATRADGYHELDATMVSISEPHDSLVDPAGRRARR